MTQCDTGMPACKLRVPMGLHGCEIIISKLVTRWHVWLTMSCSLKHLSFLGYTAHGTRGKAKNERGCHRVGGGELRGGPVANWVTGLWRWSASHVYRNPWPGTHGMAPPPLLLSARPDRASPSLSSHTRGTLDPQSARHWTLLYQEQRGMETRFVTEPCPLPPWNSKMKVDTLGRRESFNLLCHRGRFSRWCVSDVVFGSFGHEQCFQGYDLFCVYILLSFSLGFCVLVAWLRMQALVKGLTMRWAGKEEHEICLDSFVVQPQRHAKPLGRSTHLVKDTPLAWYVGDTSWQRNAHVVTT